MSESLVATLDRVLDALAAASVPYALCGGLAVNVHGHVRATRDIDLLVQRVDLDRARATLHALGFTVDAGPIPFGLGTPEERELHRVSRVEAGRLTTIDLMIVTPVLERAWASRIDATWRGRTLACVSLEGLGHMKRLAGRAQDLADLEALGLEEGDGG